MNDACIRKTIECLQKTAAFIYSYNSYYINMTTIQISERLRDKLKDMGKKGDSYEDVIQGLVEYKEREKKEGGT